VLPQTLGTIKVKIIFAYKFVGYKAIYMMLLNKTEIILFVAFSLLYLLFIEWYGWNENSRFFLTRAIVDEHRLEIDSFANQTGDRSFFKGHYYSDKDPGISLIAALPYSIFKLFFYRNELNTNQTYLVNHINDVEIYDILNLDNFTLYSMILVTFFTSVIFSALTVVLIYKISLFFTKSEFTRLIIISAAGLASSIFPYALVFIENATATFFALLGFYLLLKKKYENVDQKKYSFISGLSFGFAAITSIITIFIFLASNVYLLFLKKKYLRFFVLDFF